MLRSAKTSRKPPYPSTSAQSQEEVDTATSTTAGVRRLPNNTPYMNIFHQFLTSVLKQPLWKNLSLQLFLWGICLFTYLLSPFYGPLFAIPIALAIWLYQKRGMLISLSLSTLLIALVNTIDSHSLLWSRMLITGLFTGTLALLIEGFFILYLRYLVDRTESAYQQVIQEEQQKWRAHASHLEALQAKERAEASYEQQRQLHYLKDQFIVHVNHELRTPLTGLVGWLEILEMAQEQGDTRAQRDAFSHAKENSEELISLVNQVLEAAEISTALEPLSPVPCQVGQIAQEELARFNPHKTGDIQLQVNIDENLAVWAYQPYLRRVLHNLLSNAFKYTSRQMSVQIRAEEQMASGEERETSPYVLICVQDTGPGIPPAELPFLFEKFVRLKRDVATSIRGNGLGLYICKQLVEAMGGRIWAESSGQIGEGSQFYFLLPGVTERVASKSNDISLEAAWSHSL